MQNIYQPVSLFSSSEIKNTLESIAGKPDDKKSSGVLENLIADKTKSLKATVRALLNEIKNRENLNFHLLKSLDDKMCELASEKSNLENINTYYQWDNFLEIDKIKQKIESNVLSLESEKRREHLECWRDLMFLKKYLMSALKEYWEAVRRRGMLGREKFFNNPNY